MLRVVLQRIRYGKGVSTAAVIAAAALLLPGCLDFYRGALPNEPKGETFAQVGDAHVHYVDRGTGPAVVLIHGFGASLDSWKHVISTLEPAHRVLALDMKGFGWSDRPPGDYSPPTQAAMVFELMERLGIQHATVVGHSWGGGVALAMALQHPDRVEKLVLVDAGAYDDEFPAFVDWAKIKGLGEVLFALFYKERLDDKAPLAFYDPNLVTQEQVDKAVDAMDRPGTVAAALATMRGLRFAAQAEQYHTIRQKTLVAWGREDRVVPLAFGERLNRDIPDSRLKVYPLCGHFPMVEARDEFERDLVSFLADSPAEGAANR
jgi:pimeloyl-ACP methyl ester carboxylesterase